MRKKPLIAIFAMLFLLLHLLHPFSLAGDDLNQMALRGLKGVYVLVESLAPEVERLGVNKDRIKTDVELRLRKAGVKVLTEMEGLETPWLYVNVNTCILQNTPIVGYSISVDLNEWVKLARGFRTVGAIWHTGSVGVVGTEKIKEIRGAVGDHVDKFINDYLAANPK